jgi:glycosyltransferase involved in cell wall biosynthesis
MRVAIIRTMPNFSMDVYADALVAGLCTVRPHWDIVELAPRPADRRSRSLTLRLWKNYERFWRFPRLVNHQVADVFHIIDHSEAHIAYGLKQAGKPVAVTCHDLINLFYQNNLQGSVQLPIVSNGLWKYSVRGMQQANHIVTVSSATANDTTRILKIEPTRISVVPNAVEAIFQPATAHQVEGSRRTYGATPETICLLNVGSNHPRKNLLGILQALEILNHQGLPVQLWKAGTDFTEEQKTFIQTQKLAALVHYLGNPDKAALVQLYSAADVLVAPSFHEGFGMTLLEAMACGTPVITSNCSAMPEVVGDAGILVDPNDSQAIANAVVHLHNNPAVYQTLVERGCARAKSFTWEKAAEQIAQIYEQLLGQKDVREVATIRS